MRFFQLISTVSALLLSQQVSTVTAEPEPCPTDPSLKGFTTIGDLNKWMSTVWYFVNSGGFYPPPYFFSLCPNTVYDDTFIFPVLNDTWILCGALGSSESNCLIQTNDTQIVILPHDYSSEGAVAPPLEHVNFLGLTLRKSTDVSVGAYGSSSAWAFFKDCHWEDNLGRFAIHMLPPTSTATSIASEKDDSTRRLEENSSMLVQLVECSFKNNKLTHSTIVNNGGSLIITDAQFSDNTNAWANVLSFDNQYTHIERVVFENTKNYFTVIGIQSTLHLEETKFIGNTNDESVVHVIDKSHLTAVNCVFEDNDNAIGAGFIDDQSVLFFNGGNEGNSNAGFGCEGFLLLDKGEKCDIDGECPASCCEFGDITCDVQTSPPSVSPTMVPSSSPSASMLPTVKATTNDFLVSGIEGKGADDESAATLPNHLLCLTLISGIVGFALF